MSTAASVMSESGAPSLLGLGNTSASGAPSNSMAHIENFFWLTFVGSCLERPVHVELKMVDQC